MTLPAKEKLGNTMEANLKVSFNLPRKSTAFGGGNVLWAMPYD
jgi:hypothetical protein